MKWLIAFLCGILVVGVVAGWWILRTAPTSEPPEKVLFTLQGHKADVWTVAFAPRGKLLASADASGVIIIWDSSSGKEKGRFQFAGAATIAAVTLVAWGPDGITLYAAGQTGLQGWNKEGPFLRGHNDAVKALAFSPDGKLLASGSFDQTVKLWDVSGYLMEEN
jgi:WD40 repeat protein